MLNKDTWEFINTFAPWLAAFGTLMAVIVSLYLAMHDRRISLIVEALPDNLHGEAEFHYIKIEIANIGKRTAVIKDIHWKIFSRKIPYDIKSDKELESLFPIKLDDGEIFKLSIPLYFYDSFNATPLSNEFGSAARFPALKAMFTKICVVTSAGRVFNKRIDMNLRKDLVRYSKMFKNMWTKEN